MKLVNKLLADPLGMYLIVCVVLIVVLIVTIFFLIKLYLAERRIADDANKREDITKGERDRLKNDYFNLDNNYRVLLKRIKQFEEKDKNLKQQEKSSGDNSSGYEDYIKREKEKKNVVQETTNDDGTTRSDIIFEISNDDTKSESISSKIEYLDAANGGQFRKLLPSDEKSFFRTWEENGIRKFEFHGNVDKALANINAIFDDVCEIEGKQNGATHISNIEPGILDSQLKVEKKAKIKLT